MGIIGTVVKSEGVSERVAPEDLMERLNKGTLGGGSLNKVMVEEIVCSQSEFDDKAPKFENSPQPFYLFIPFNEANLPDGQYREVLLPNRRYLLLLTDHDSASLKARYELDPQDLLSRRRA